MTKNQTVALLLSLSLSVTAAAQTTTFSYQGRLDASGQPYSGPLEVMFSLWDDPQAGNQLAGTSPEALSLTASHGLFMAELDFGAEPFAAGKERWLEIQLRTDLGAFVTLTPRRRLLATPYAMTAVNLAGDLPAGRLSGTLSSAQLGGTYSGAITLDNAANSLAGNGAELTGLNASQLTAGTVPDARLGAGIARTSNVWSLGGNSGTDPLNQYIGTSDETPLVIRAGGQGIMRLEGDVNGLRIIAGRSQSLDGSSTNSAILSGRQNSIRGEAHESVIAGGLENVIELDQRSAFIGGGARNRILQDNQHAVIVGGRDNRIGTNSVISLVVGGADNILGNNVDGGLMVGGFRNDIFGSGNPGTRAIAPVLLGGSDNEIGLGSSWAVVVGGDNNRIGTNAASSIIVGGTNNIIANNANHSFASGRRSRVNHQGAFVWSDSQNVSFASAGNDTFNIRAQGGIQVNGDTSQFFGTTSRQMLNLYDTRYGIGVQSGTQYYRTASTGSFSWFRGGVHSDSANSAGAGGLELMRLNSTGLRVNGTFVSASDRDIKDGFAAIDSKDVLSKVAALPITRWHYTNDTGTLHLGPVAQDFHAAFGLGADDKHIAMVDADGVALAAIQGLNQKVDAEAAALRAENSVLREQNAELLRRLESIEQRLR